MSVEGAVLVVGGDGLIGRAVADETRRRGRHVFATTRRSAKASPDTPFLDLTYPDTFVPPAGIATAILCAGVGRIDACGNDPTTTTRINVDGTIDLAHRLLNHGIRIVYLSTSQVFDGIDPAPLPDTPVSPLTEYGRQRAAAEQALMIYDRERVAVVRLTKVIESCRPLLTGWLDAFRRGETITPYDTLFLSPVPLAGVVERLFGLLDTWRSGRFHLSGDQPLSYAEAALIGATLLAIPSSQVSPHPAPLSAGGAIHLGDSCASFESREVIETFWRRLISETTSTYETS